MSSPAFAKPQHAGIVLYLDSDGLIRQILRDDAGVFSSAEQGVSFASLVDRDSFEKAQEFLREVKVKGAAFDCELNTRGPGDIRCLHFAAGKATNGIWATASTSRVGLAQLYHWMTQQDLFARERGEETCDKAGADDYVIAEFSRLNNELVNAQRELAKKLARTEQLRIELCKSEADLEQKVGDSTRDLSLSVAAVQSEIAAREQTEARLRDLSGTILRLQDEERRRVARELHDSTGQTLAAIKMTVASLRNAIERHTSADELFEDLNVLADQAIKEIRTTSHLLHPPLLDEIGLESAARFYAEEFARRSQIQVELDIEPLDRLPEALEMVLFRVLQESLTNVLRHSGSAKARIHLKRELEGIVLEIRDYGKGIPAERIEKFMRTGEGVGVGLGGMRERAREVGGTLQIESGTSGTVVRVVIPKLPLSGQ